MQFIGNHPKNLHQNMDFPIESRGFRVGLGLELGLRA